MLAITLQINLTNNCFIMSLLSFLAEFFFIDKLISLFKTKPVKNACTATSQNVFSPEYDRRISDIKSRISDLEGRIEDYDGSDPDYFDEIEDELNAINSDIDDFNSDIDDFDNDIDDFDLFHDDYDEY